MKTWSSLLVLSAMACGGTEPLAGEAIDTAADLRSRAGNTSVWMESAGVASREGDAWVLRMRGRTSRNLAGAFSFVPDDAFAEARVVGPRSFELVVRAGHELNSLLSGLPLLVRLDTTDGASLTARVTLGLRWSSFRGSSAVRLDERVRPIAVRGGDRLAYRSDVHATSTTLTVQGTSATVVQSGARDFTADLDYARVEQLLTARTRVTFQARPGTSKSALLEVFPALLDTTLLDPYDAWPAEACTPELYTCANDVTSELASCGTYREVQRCLGVDVCEVFETAPLSVRPLDLSFVWAEAADAFVADCARGGTWCSLTSVEAFTVPECLASPATAAELAGLIEPGIDGVRLDRASITGTPYFSSAYSAGGPGFFSAIDGHMGGGVVEGWYLSQPGSCHNCTSFDDVLLLWYPAASRAVVVRGTHGYDS
jgi:hypothetical protein